MEGKEGKDKKRKEEEGGGEREGKKYWQYEKRTRDNGQITRVVNYSNCGPRGEGAPLGS